MEILRVCYYRKCHRDYVIRKQGKPWQRLYIVMRGSLTIYFNDEGVGGTPEPEVDVKEEESCPSIPTFPPIFGFASKTKKTVRFKDESKDYVLDRRKLGRSVATLEGLQSFGQLSFLSGDFAAEGTVVADEKTELMVIPGKKVLERVQVYEKRELDQKKLFVRTHSFFSKSSEAHQELIIAALTRSYCPLGCTIVRQGSPVVGLHFLIRGRARLSTTSSKHRKQYPDIFINYDEFRNSPDPRDDLIVRLPSINMRERNTMAPHAYVRRTAGYAAAEKLVFDRNIELCFVEEGEICGDTEVLLGLDTHIFTVTASTPCELYTLSLKCYENHILKKNSQTINLIKMVVETKLLGRKSTIPGNKIELLPLLLYRLRFIRQIHMDMAGETNETGTEINIQRHGSYESPHDKDARQKTVKNMHSLENRGSEGMIVDWYKRNKAPLLRPVTEGAVYYKEMMQKRSKMREEMRKKYPNDSAVCQVIRKRVKDAILASIKDGFRADNMVRKVRLQLSNGRAWTKWK
ncbi:uncharacterized protein LOC110459143 isoform X2 [Mizuhopecten yessoensis]|nr:uncharacterized protein LOC110459143 isoform X2 [Mizuhopecten yessoensis]